MSTKNQKHTVKLSTKAYKALSEVADNRFGNEDAITWSGLVYLLCQESQRNEAEERNRDSKDIDSPDS